MAPRVRWDRSFRELGRPACRMPANCAKGARGSGPRGRGSPSSPRSSVPDEKVGRRREAEWPRPPRPSPRGKWRLAVPLAPAPAPLPFQGLFRAEPWESVSPVAEISLEPARRGCKLPSPPRPPRPPSGAGAGARGRRGARGPARSHPRPAAAAGSATSSTAAGVKRRESINQPTQPSPKPGAPPAGPALCLARLPARGLGSRAGPLRGPGGAARSHQRPRWPESHPILSHPVTGTIQA